MAIKRIDSKTPNLQSYIDIPVSEIREIHNKIIHNYETNLKKYGVKNYGQISPRTALTKHLFPC